MANLVEERMLIQVNAANNNNKFYHVQLFDDDTVTKRWGRVGSNGTTSVERSGRSGFEHIIRTKTRGGYKPTEIVSATVTVNASAATTELSKVAKTVLSRDKGNPIIDALIDRLVRINRHQILENSGGLIKVNHDGVITTPLGLVSLNSISAAKRLLNSIEDQYNRGASTTAITPLLEEYLTYIPQKVARQKWQDTFISAESLKKQREFLKQLKESLEFHEANAAAQIKADAADDNTDAADKYKNLFRYNISILEDPVKFKEIKDYYESTKSNMHGAARLKLKRVYVLTDDTQEAKYQEVLTKIGNERRLWHGSQASNILSILRMGLFTPPVRGGTYNIQGRMFGDGIYFSDISSKSLNYAAGYWGGSRDTNCFMFLADVALGMEYRPTHRFDVRESRGSHPKYKKPYNSTFIKGNTCGVLNNEFVAYTSEQVQLRYLCEFDI